MYQSNNQLQNITFGVYYRKSSESEDRQASSIDDQRKEMQRHAERHRITIAKEYSESKSAKQPGREQFNQMMTDLHNGKINGILCWKLNRLARNPMDGGQIQWALQQGIARAIVTNNRSYLPTDNVMIMAVELGVGNQFIQDLSNDTKRGMRQKALRGWYPQSVLPIGYIHAPKLDQYNNHTNPEIEIIRDPERFDIARRMWEHLLSGKCSVGQIYKMAHEQWGLRNKKGGKYAVNTIHQMFKKRFYYGEFEWLDEDRIRQTIQGKHDPMISKVEFKRAQLMLGKHSANTRPEEKIFAFRGIIRCGHCDCLVTAQEKIQVKCTQCKKKFSSKNKGHCPGCEIAIKEMTNPIERRYVYYGCSKGKNKAGAGCKQKAVTEQYITEQIESTLQGLYIPECFHEWLMEQFRNHYQKTRGAQQKINQQIKKRETKQLKKIDQATLMRAGGEIDADEFKNIKESLSNDLTEIRSQISGTHEEALDWFEKTETYLNLSEIALNAFKNGGTQMKHNILASLGQNQKLMDKTLIFQLPQPFFALKQLSDDLVGLKENPDGLEPAKVLENIAQNQEKSPYSDSFPSLLRRQDSNL